MKDCNLWNTADLGKYTWQIAKKEDILWIQWVHNVNIKDIELWDYTAPSCASWAWKMICQVKEKLKSAHHNNT